MTCFIPCALYDPKEGDRFGISLPIARQKPFNEEDVGVSTIDTPRFDIPLIASLRGSKGSKDKATFLLESSLDILGLPMTIIFNYRIS